MSQVMYPSGYGTRERTLDELMNAHCPVASTEPEFRRRLRHFLASKNGLIGIGDFLPRGSSTISAASASDRSFHQLQRFSDGKLSAAAVDLVVRRTNAGHSSGAVPWHEVPTPGSGYARSWGMHVNVPGEPWHIQCIEMFGHARWVNDGRRRPDPKFQLPCTEKPAPALVFDPRNGRWGLWPPNKSKAPVSTESFAMHRRSRADNRWVWTGDIVSYLQGVILHKAGGNITVDGWYGPKTEARLRDVQRTFKVPIDGLVGQKTWDIIDFLASK